MKVFLKNKRLWSDYMKLHKQYQFWLSLIVGLIMAVCTYPYDHDRYIPDILTAFVFCLNTFSAILFSTILYFIWTKRVTKKSILVFLLLTIIQTIGHGIFIVMNWGSFFYLPLSIIVFIILVALYFREKKETSQ